MLIGIDPILSPELVKILMEMGHGDEIVFADANFPSASTAQRLIRFDGHSIPSLLKAVLPLFPLDQYVPQPAALMAVEKKDAAEPAIWEEYKILLRDLSGYTGGFELIERMAFYERTKKTYAVVATGESALYANIILKKGVIKPDA